MPQVIRLPMQRRDAMVNAESFDEAAYTIDVIWTTGATVRRRSWSFWDDEAKEFDEELVVSANAIRLERLNAGAPFLNTHGQYDLRDVIGSVVPGTARIEKSQGLATIRLSRAPSDTDTVQKIRDAIIRNVSVGYRIHAVEKQERDSKIPLHRVTDWEPIEISAVPIGADPGAQVRGQVAEAALFDCVVSRTGGSNEVARIGAQMLHLHHGISR